MARYGTTQNWADFDPRDSDSLKVAVEARKLGKEIESLWQKLYDLQDELYEAVFTKADEAKAAQLTQQIHDLREQIEWASAKHREMVDTHVNQWALRYRCNIDPPEQIEGAKEFLRARGATIPPAMPGY